MKKLLTVSRNACLLVLLLLCLASCGNHKPKGPELKVDINATKTSEPISPFIYGQFIEHLGRCIYGGIWAEMLQDRKFYFPVKDDYEPYGTQKDEHWNAGDFKVLKASPWKVVQPKGTVKMNTTATFVGEQSPEIKLQGDKTEVGIGQPGLELVDGKEYKGYVYLSGSPSAKVTVRLSSGTSPQYLQIAAFTGLKTGYARYDFSFTAKSPAKDVALEIVGIGTGIFRIGTVSLMPADNVEGFRPRCADTAQRAEFPYLSLAQGAIL